MIITIDGPAGAGKTSVSRYLTQRLPGFQVMDTGAMYRAVAWLALQKSIELTANEDLGQLAQHYPLSWTHTSNNEKQLWIAGKEISRAIRTPVIDQAVTPVCQQPAVREALVVQQRQWGATGNWIAEGRDMGTVVFPQADLKIFLTADPAIRAQRRYRQNQVHGLSRQSLQEIQQDMLRRDQADESRSSSPLVPADDAFIIDGTDLTLQEVVSQIVDSWEMKNANGE